jgi:predicted DNA repair protein MutK
MTKVATKKTAGVLGDDLALNAEQVAGVSTDREWPVIWAVAKRSLVNKCALVPAAVLISALTPFLVQPLLMIGGAFLCFEGAEKLLAWRRPHVARPSMTEAERVRGASRTDFILSAEILVIALGTVAEAALVNRVLVLTAIALLMTVGVYGLVACIVKIDDVGLALSKRGGVSAVLGHALLALAPRLMKGLSVAGTVAMFLVGGGIVGHGVGPIREWLDPMSDLAAMPIEGAIGLVVGAVLVGVQGVVGKARGALALRSSRPSAL